MIPYIDEVDYILTWLAIDLRISKGGLNLSCSLVFVDVLVVFGKAFFCSPCAMYFAGVAVQVAVLLYE